jgi:hypothetical protein
MLLSIFLLLIWSTNFLLLKEDDFEFGFIVIYHIGGVMVSILTSSAVERGFELRSGQPQKTIKTGICCFYTKEKKQRLVGSESG